MLQKFYNKFYLRRLVKRGLKCGKNLQIEKGVNIDAVFPELISIGDHVVLARNVYILAHDGSTKHHIGYTRVGRTTIGNNCFIGASSIVLPGISIGNNSIIGCGSIVTKDVPENEVWAGNPAKRICSLNQFVDKHKKQLAIHKPLILNGKKNLER